MKKGDDALLFYIFNSELNDIAKENNLEKLKLFKIAHPNQNDAIDQAFVSLQNLKVVSTYTISEEIVEQEYDKLIKKVKYKKRILYPVWLSIAAACACLIFIIPTIFHSSQPNMKNKNQIFSTLDSMKQINTNEIQIISGDDSVFVANNQGIKQGKDGNVLVDGQEKLKSENIKTEYIQLMVPNGRLTNIILSDGTKVWLNSGSKLLYPKFFADDKREIFIDGEIYLEVSKDTKRPFYVHGKKFDIKVLGTKFNVNTYLENKNTIILVEGSVEVTVNNQEHILAPNQGLFFEEDGIKMKHVDTYKYICWKDGFMIVDGESLGSIFDRLSRYYNLNIVYDMNIANEKYQGRLNLEDSIEVVLYNLSLSSAFMYEKENDIIKIHM